MTSAHPRYLNNQILEDLQRKMVFVGGPRQVGKTTLARSLPFRGSKEYLNWDSPPDRERILRHEIPPTDLLILDEIHKYRPWRNFVKGLFDTERERMRILVTGSARLDLYRRGGDSLQGRYHYLRLHPLTVAELGIKKAPELAELLELSGFPEPFFGSSSKQAKRWSKEYRSRLIREDIASLESIQDLGTLELMTIRLPELVGSPLSINSLREDLQVNHRTVARWCEALERIYSIFRLRPFGSKRVRAVKKEQKHYHYDWTLVPDESLRFENLVACHLLKWVQFLQDTEGRDIELGYFRDVTGREVDFVVIEKNKPTLAVECKWSDTEPSPHLRYFKSKFPDCPAWQIHMTSKKDYVSSDGVRVAPAIELLKTWV